MCKKYYSWNPSTCICENSMYLKSFADDSAKLDEIISTTGTILRNVANTVSTNVKSAVSINSDDKKLRYNGLL